MDLNEYEQKQQNILYGNGTHQTHQMFMDLEDMIMWCVTCKFTRNNFENKHLKWRCLGPPKRITLCGSTKFKEQFQYWNRELTLMGHVVYSVAFFGHADDESLTGMQKELLDKVHFKKIDNSDAIFVINVDDYIGESTRNEIIHAVDSRKLTVFMNEFIGEHVSD